MNRSGPPVINNPLPEHPSPRISAFPYVKEPKQEPKKGPITHEYTRKRPPHGVICETNAPAKRKKIEPVPVAPTSTLEGPTKTTRAHYQEPKCSELGSLPMAARPVPKENTTKSEPLCTNGSPQTQSFQRASTTGERMPIFTTPTKHSHPEIALANERKPRKSFTPALPCSNPIQNVFSAKKEKNSEEHANLGLHRNVRAHRPDTMLFSAPVLSQPPKISVPAASPTPVCVNRTYPSRFPTCKPSVEFEIEPVTPSARPQSAGASVASSSQSVVLSSASRIVDDDETLKFCFTYGMVVVERDSNMREAEWIACKFCPVFGCKKRNSKYIMAVMRPFQTEVILKHLRSEHPIIWPKYNRASELVKRGIFRGKQLPSLEVFQDRVLQLKSCYGKMTSKDREKLNERRNVQKTERKRIENEKRDALLRTMEDKGIGDNTLTRQHSVMNTRNDTDANMNMKGGITIRNETGVSSRDMLACARKQGEGDEDEGNPSLLGGCGVYASDWIGRTTFRNGNMIRPSRKLITYDDRRFKNEMVEKLLEPVWVTRDKLLHLYLPKEMEDLISCGVLAESSHCVGKSGLFFHPGNYLLCEERPGKQKWDKRPCSFAWKEYLFITALTYFGRGFSIHTIEEMLEPMLDMVAPEWVVQEGSLKDMVWRMGNSVCAESMRLVRTILRNEFNWLLIPTFVACEAMGESGVEILLPVLFNSFELYFVHLISVRDGEDVEDAVISVLRVVCEDWEEKVGGFYSHISDEDKCRKRLERKITRGLGELAKMDGLRTFERGQKEVEEQTVSAMCEMDVENVMQKIWMFIKPYMAFTKKSNEKQVCEAMLKELNGMKSGELFDVTRCYRTHSSSWRKVGDRFNRELVKYMNGLQVIWRQETMVATASIEIHDGGFVHRHEKVGQSGIVKDWRCESVVDATLERSSCGRNVCKLRCVLRRSKMYFKSDRARSRQFSFQAAHMFDTNWSNVKRGRC